MISDPIQERLDLMEWHFSKVVGLLIVMARGQQIDPDTIAEVTAPPPLPRSISQSGQSGLSPSVGISSLALSDAHSTASTRSSTKSDKPGMYFILNIVIGLHLLVSDRWADLSKYK
jgi:hypothetical protein